MNKASQPFFLPTASGQRFCLFHAPAPGASPRGVVVYAHPFAEEMNKARRMASLQARALAEQGFGVLQIDLYGCGDSAGELAQARWHNWTQDLECACGHALTRARRPLILWGLRLGALLALDFATEAARPIDALLLWQPVISGEAHLRQFLRLQNTARLVSPGAAQAPDTENATQAGGYTISQALRADLDALDATRMTPPCSVSWIEHPGPSGRELPPASVNLIGHWIKAGITVDSLLAPGLQFWSTGEQTENLAFIAATRTCLALQGQRS